MVEYATSGSLSIPFLVIGFKQIPNAIQRLPERIEVIMGIHRSRVRLPKDCNVSMKKYVFSFEYPIEKIPNRDRITIANIMK